jgi:hypothetical protein
MDVTSVHKPYQSIERRVTQKKVVVSNKNGESWVLVYS